MTEWSHIPVLLDEVLEYIGPVSGSTIFDGTLGSGGHAEAILEASSPDGRLIGCDRDPSQLEITRARLARFSDRATLVRGSYEDAADILAQAHVENVDGFLIDCGVSLDQLSPEGDVGRGRGFSRRGDEPLLMSYDPDSGRTGARLLAESDEDELREVFGQILRPGETGRVVRAIIRQRDVEPIETTGQFTQLLHSVFGSGGPKAGKRISAAYLALRAGINSELEGLETGIRTAIEVLRPGGVLAVISFHGAEMSLVRGLFRELQGGTTGPPRLIGAPERPALIEVLARKPLFPSDEEVARNPAARSARLHAARKL